MTTRTTEPHPATDGLPGARATGDTTVSAQDVAHGAGPTGDRDVSAATATARGARRQGWLVNFLRRPTTLAGGLLSVAHQVPVVRADPGRLQFGGADFVRVADFLSDVQTVDGVVRRAIRALRQPQYAAVALRLLALLPKTRVSLSASPSGREFADVFERRLAGYKLPRVAQSVLVLPETLPEYLKGKPRQALRTGLNQARKAGFVCTEIVDPEERLAAVGELERDRGFVIAHDPNLHGVHGRWFAARDGEGQLIALGVVLIDEQVALLRFMVAVDTIRNASAGRYLLHTHMVEEVLRARARLMVVNSPFGWPRGLHHFQRMLGYRVNNVVILD